MTTRTWTDEQSELIEIGPDGKPRLARVAVAADAGAGKTSVLVERVRRLGPTARALCVSFTEKSKADLEQRLADRLNAEVYTIHGFCARVVSEFGARIGLPPFSRILAADECEEIFYESFEKVYRRAPPANLERRVGVVLSICSAAAAESGSRIHDLAGDTDGDLKRFVDEVLAEFEGSKHRKRVLEYSDLERRALELLRLPEVRGPLRSRYDHIFVDEFQDTSEAQCELVELLTGAERPVFVVGDTKQSIYRFRGADVEVFGEFIGRLPERRRLSSNFRSHAEVIDAVNAVCAPAIAGYEPMIARRPDDHQELDPAVFAELPRVARVTCDDDGEGIAAIVHGLEARGVQRSEIVLLLRKVSGRAELFKGLAERGIPVALSSSGSAKFNEELGRLLNLWIWACEPWQRLRAAQVAADFGLAPRGSLGEEIRRLETEGLGAALGTCEALLGVLDARFGLQARFGAIYEQFSVFVLGHQSKGLSPAALARRLQHLLSNGEDISGFTLLAPPADAGGSGAIRVLTIHASKGLEFPVVILGDVGRQRARSTGILRTGRDVWVPDYNEKGELDWTAPGVKEAKERELEADRAESARKLYVAMTRAQEALYVVDRPPPPLDPEKAAKAAKKKPAEPTWGSWLKDGIARTITAQAFRGEAADERAARAPMLAREAASPLEPVPPVYHRARVGVSQSLGGDEPSRSSFAGRGKLMTTADPRDLGIAIHRCFELADWDGLRREARAAGLDLSAFWAWMDTEEAQCAFAEGERARAPARAYNELAFEWKRDGVVLAGRIDRLIIGPRGASDEEAWVIDYKILLSRRPAEDVLDEYGPQLSLYADAVRKLVGGARVRAFLLDVTAATGRVWHEVPVTLEAGKKFPALDDQPRPCAPPTTC